MGEDWKLNHVGLMITNRNATLRHFQARRIGISVGPQPLLPHENGEGSLMFYRTLDGDPVTNTYRTGGAHTFKDGNCQIGNCQLECYPMKPGPGMFIGEYLERKGPGVNHICFNTNFIDEDTGHFLKKDCALTFNATVNGKTVENYLDTRAHGDLMISLRPPASQWERAWRENNEQHPLVNDWKFLGLGIGVFSVSETISYYENLGFSACSDLFTDKTCGLLYQAVKVGPVKFVFCETLGKASIIADSLARRGEGVSTLVFEVADLELELGKLQEHGTPVFAESSDGMSLYFDTRDEGNLILQLRQAA